MFDLGCVNSAVSIPLIGLSCFSIVALVVGHVFAGRYSEARSGKFSPQLLLVRLALIFNAPVIGGAWLIARHESRNTSETIYMLAFVFLVFNGIAYAYFHFFNMSETARRIRMLLQIRLAGPDGLRVQELESEYSQQDMIEARLDRLVKLRQLALEPDGRYRVAGHTLLWAGRVMGLWRRLVLRHALRNTQ